MFCRELSEAHDRETTGDILDPRCITPVERAREKRKIRKEKTNASLSNNRNMVREALMSFSKSEVND